MAKKIKSWLLWFARTFQFAPDLFDFGPGELRYRRRLAQYPYATTAEAWRHDWENIGGDFRRAAAQLESEIA